MLCHAARNVLDLHVEGRLTAARAAQVAGHLEACRPCREEAGATAPLAARRAPAAPAALKDRLAALLEGPAPPPGPSRVPPRDFDDAPMTRECFVTLEWAAALAAFLLILNIVGPGIPSQGLPEPPPAEEGP